MTTLCASCGKPIEGDDNMVAYHTPGGIVPMHGGCRARGEVAAPDDSLRSGKCAKCGSIVMVVPHPNGSRYCIDCYNDAAYEPPPPLEEDFGPTK